MQGSNDRHVKEKQSVWCYIDRGSHYDLTQDSSIVAQDRLCAASVKMATRSLKVMKSHRRAPVGQESVGYNYQGA